mgnify:CR=1 FL=1
MLDNTKAFYASLRPADYPEGDKLRSAYMVDAEERFSVALSLGLSS